MRTAGTVLVLAAGQGTRMRSELPKVLHRLHGRPLLGHVLDQALALEPERVVVVVGHGADEVRGWVAGAYPEAPVRFVLQAEQKGTGHAVMVASDELAGASGPVVVLYGDMPLLRPESLRALCGARPAGGAALLTATPREARGFGRILRGPGGAFRGIVEEKDASPEERAIREVNVGVYAFGVEELLASLPRLSAENAQGEYYLTDVLRLLVDEGRSVATVALADEREAIGINTPEHLAEAEAVLGERAGTASSE